MKVLTIFFCIPHILETKEPNKTYNIDKILTFSLVARIGVFSQLYQ